MALIRELGNCGSLDKLKRIMQALEIAKRHQTKVVIMMDPLVYGKNSATFTAEEIEDYKVDASDLYIGTQQFGWWDIQRVNLLF